MDGFDMLGAEIGFDYGALLQTAGGIASGVASSYEDSQKQDKQDKESQGNLATAIAADLNATNATAQADVASQLKSKSAASDLSKAQAAVAASDAAGVNLTPDQQQARVEAANKALAFAQAQAQKSPKDGYKKAVVNAWTATINRMQNPSTGSDRGGKQGNKDQEGWLTRRVLGPIPGYGVLVLGFGLAGLGGIAVKRLFF